MVCAWEEPRARRQRSEQYLTSSQTFAHFLRQTNGRPQVMQFFCGRSDFFIGLQRIEKLPAVVLYRLAFFAVHPIKALIHEAHARITT
jgi:hypothetical protein